MKDGTAAASLTDGQLEAEFKMTEDESVSFGIVGRMMDRSHFYLARVNGAGWLELLKVKDGKETAFDFVQPNGDPATRLTGMVPLRRYREGELWKLSFRVEGEMLTAILFDAEGQEQARIAARDKDFKQGAAGLRCTTFAAASSFRIAALKPFVAAPVATEKTDTVQERDYPVVRPWWKTDELNTPAEKIGGGYDIIIAGAGTGGWAAAIQAARMGARVLLLEETDWIGGQMSAAAVTTMDEASVALKFPVRERGIYREFHESMVTHYQTLNKDPFVTYYAYPDQLEGGYEPKATRAVLYGFIKEVRENNHALLDLSLRSRVVEVRKQGEAITGVVVEITNEQGSTRKSLSCKVMVDATEYGDVIPLTGARYRSGNSTSAKLNPAALVQDHTWTAVVREYPAGVPDHLKIKTPPPGYETGAGRRYRNYQEHGFMLWGGAGKGIKGARHWRVYFAWRGMADSDSPLTGLRSAQRHTQCGFNGGNDYPVTVATLENAQQRLLDEREGIYRTLGTLYYFQHELGVNWGLAEDEGYATAYNRAKMKALDLRPDLEAMAVHLPQQPYVRESRRIMGVGTLVANDLTRFEEARHVTTSVSMGDYFMDLDHGKTAHAIETDLDTENSPKGGGPFQVPFEVFIPEKIDGFLPAEKNFSQSRLANGATRLQPITMLTGQAVGVLAALSVKQGKQPRALDSMQVQAALLEAGATLIQRWYADVSWGSPLWRATQLLSLHRVMDRPGAIEKDSRIPLASQAQWGAAMPMQVEELNSALTQLAKIKGLKAPAFAPHGGQSVSLKHLETALGSIHPSWASHAQALKAENPDELTAGEFAQTIAALLPVGL